MEIARERAAAEDLARKMSIDIESLIFGIRSIDKKQSEAAAEAKWA
jgi:hypothetical protein